MFLHGSGERGDDIDKVRVHGPPKRVAEFAELRGAVIVSPQCPAGGWWRVKTVKSLVDSVIVERGDIDMSRRRQVDGEKTGKMFGRISDGLGWYFQLAEQRIGSGNVQRLGRQAAVRARRNDDLVFTGCGYINQCDTGGDIRHRLHAIEIDAAFA